MVMLRRLLLVITALMLLGLGWIWWDQPEPVNMALYVPADALIFIEANSLFDMATSVTATEAWQQLAPAAGLQDNFGRFGWLSRLVMWTGIGPAHLVGLTRAQVAVAVLSFEATEEDGATLKVMPRLALVAETHMSEWRVRAMVEKQVGDFARRTYDAPQFERTEKEGTTFFKWSVPTNTRQRIIAAVTESVAVIGNDEGAVEACLAAHRGERPSLVSDVQLEEMRTRLTARDALAFGYIPASGAAKLVEVAALAYAGQLSENPQLQSILAVHLPELSAKVLRGGAWSTRVTEGAVEDQYFLDLPDDLAARISEALASNNALADQANELLPADTYQFSLYNFRSPETAWRGFNAALSSQLDALSAPFVNRFLEAALRPYGITEPREFLRAAGPALVTARLDDTGSSTVLIVGVRAQAALQRLVRQHLGQAARSVRVGQSAMLVAAEEERGAASFVNNHLIMGAEENVRRCLEAHQQAQTLNASARLKHTPRHLLNAPAAAVITFTDDQAAAQDFISYFARGHAAQTIASKPMAWPDALMKRGYAVSESRFTVDGFEKITRSSFGNVGALITWLAPDLKSE